MSDALYRDTISGELVRGLEDERLAWELDRDDLLDLTDPRPSREEMIARAAVERRRVEQAHDHRYDLYEVTE